jgi:large repetitive protein
MMKNTLSNRKTQAGRIRVAQETSSSSIKPVAAPSPMASLPAAASLSVQRPRSQHYALEQRVLFDGAGFAAIDMQMDGAEQQHQEAQRIAAEQARAVQERERSGELQQTEATPKATAGKTVVVIDARVGNYQDLVKDIDPNAVLRVIRAGEDGVAVISKLLGETGNVSSLQIVSHGTAGSIRLGSAVLDSNALNNSATAAELASWRGAMTANADILILGCDVAQGEKGQSFVQKLADLTQADISASVDDTGAAAKGGNWVLEFNVGQVESFYAFSEASMRNYDRVLPAGPTSALTVPTTTLIGSTGNKASVTFDNTGTVGYSPYLVVGFDRSGTDPNPNAVPTEGVEYKLGSAKLNSGTVASERIVNITIAGPFSIVGFNDGAGQPIIFNAADYGLGIGDQLVIWELPFGSFTPDQPAARIDFEYNVGNNADSGNTVVQGGQGAGKELVIASKAFFALGNSPAGSAIVQEAVVSSAPTNPQWYTTQYINTSRELEQVPGSNDKQQFQAVLNIAPDQAILSGAGVTNALNPGATTDRYISRLSVPQVTIDGIPTTAASFQTTDIKLTQGAGLAAPLIPGATEYFVVDKISGAPATQNSDGSWSSAGGVEIIAIAAANTRITGSPTLNFEYFIIDRVIDPISGADVPQNFDAKHTGTVDFNDGDDANAAFVVDPAPVLIEYETIQIQKSVAGPYADVLAAPLGDNGVNPNAVRSGDTLTYTLTIQVSDFYGLRGAVVTDVLPDGVDFNVGSMQITGANVNGQAFTPITNAGSFMTDAGGTLGTYTVARQADEGGGTITVGGGGKQALQLNLSTALAANGITNTGIGGANTGDLLGDKFGTALGQGLTTVTIKYTATVRDTYRDNANGNLSSGTNNLLENDVLKNDVRVHGNLLTNTGGAVDAAANITSGVINADESSASVTIKDGALLLQVYAINGDTTFAKQGGKALIAPGDNVTYRIRYDLAQGDYNNLKLSTFLPDPIFKATDMNADGTANGTAEMTRITVAARDNLNGSIGSTANWAQAGAYTLGPKHDNSSAGTGGIIDTPLLSSLAVNDATLGNRIEFSIGDSSRTSNPGGANNAHTSLASEKIDILFTVKARDGQNFSDDLLLTAQGNERSERSVNGGVTEATPLPDDRIIQLKLIR